MLPRVDPVRSDTAMPLQTRVAIIGGGIIGVCAALFLARKGIAVVLCDKGHIAGEQSGRNWGWCRALGRDPREFPLAIESLRLWRSLDAMLQEKTGFRQCGILHLAETTKDLRNHESWLAATRSKKADARLVGRAEIEWLLPGSARRWAGALHAPSDGRAEPQQAVPAIARAAQRLGVTILTGCAVRTIESRAGRVSAAVTERGPIACEVVILAGGAWSSLFCGNLGIRLPQLKILSSALRTAPLAGGPQQAILGPGFALRRHLDGSYTVAQGSTIVAPIVPDSLRFLPGFRPALRRVRGNIRLPLGRRFIEEWRTPRNWASDATSPFERCRVLDPDPTDWLLNQAWSNLQRALPIFAGVAVGERWAGFIDVTPDVLPVISPIESMPGLIIATGFSGHGFGVGPAAGHLAADLAAGDAPRVDPLPFRFSRFATRAA